MTIARAHLVDTSVTRWYHHVVNNLGESSVFGATEAVPSPMR
jgi:hypothetical protein